MKPIVIPDLHRHAGLLGACLAAFPTRDIVVLGDYVDRGPDSPGVMRRVRELVECGRAVALLGNHDHLMIEASLRRDTVFELL